MNSRWLNTPSFYYMNEKSTDCCRASSCERTLPRLTRKLLRDHVEMTRQRKQCWNNDIKRAGWTRKKKKKKERRKKRDTGRFVVVNHLDNVDIVLHARINENEIWTAPKVVDGPLKRTLDTFIKIVLRVAFFSNVNLHFSFFFLLLLSLSLLSFFFLMIF